MKFVELAISPTKRYAYKTASDIEMNILGDFLASDVGYRPLPFKQWAFDNTSENACGSLTALEKENGYILLTDTYAEEQTSTVLQMTHEQFVQILTDWEEKVCNAQPKGIVIQYENNQFVIETKILNEEDQATLHPTIASHSYPLWIKFGFLISIIIFSVYLRNITSYFLVNFFK